MLNYADLKVGQRVRYPGFTWRDEKSWRSGVITEVYNGARSYQGPTILIEVKFDDGGVQRGFLPGGGLELEPIVIVVV